MRADHRPAPLVQEQGPVRTCRQLQRIGLAAAGVALAGLAFAGSAAAQARLDARYVATLAGLPIDSANGSGWNDRAPAWELRNISSPPFLTRGSSTLPGMGAMQPCRCKSTRHL